MAERFPLRSGGLPATDDGRIDEALPCVAGLCCRLDEESRALSRDPEPPAAEDVQAILADAAGILRRVLGILGGEPVTPEVGDAYDPQVHLAVGEKPCSSAVEGRVLRVLRPGYRSGRGDVVLPARVLIGVPIAAPSREDALEA